MHDIGGENVYNFCDVYLLTDSGLDVSPLQQKVHKSHVTSVCCADATNHTVWFRMKCSV
jgi:hypothetical protein